MWSIQVTLETCLVVVPVNFLHQRLVVAAKSLKIQAIEPSQVFLPVLTVAAKGQADDFVQIHIEKAVAKPGQYAFDGPVFLEEGNQHEASEKHPASVVLAQCGVETINRHDTDAVFAKPLEHRLAFFKLTNGAWVVQTEIDLLARETCILVLEHKRIDYTFQHFRIQATFETDSTMSLKATWYRDKIRKKVTQGFQGYPASTITYYGPDDKVASKVAVSVILEDGGEPVALMRLFNQTYDIRNDAQANEEIVEFLKKHGVKSVISPDRILGCPHEEGIDYPEGEKCPKCSFWSIRDRFLGTVIH